MQELITAEIAGDFRTWTVRLFQTGADYEPAELGLDALPTVAAAEPELLLEYGDRSASAKLGRLFPSSVRVSFLDPDSALYDALAKVEAERGAGVLRLQVEGPAAIGPRASTWYADPGTGEPGMDGPYAWRGYARLDTSEAPLFPGIDGQPLRISAGCGLSDAKGLDAITATDPAVSFTAYQALREALADDGAGDALPLRWFAPTAPSGIAGVVLNNLRFRPLIAYDDTGTAVTIYTDAFRDGKGAPIKRRTQIEELALMCAARVFQAFSAEVESGVSGDVALPAWRLAPLAIAGEQFDPTADVPKLSGLGEYGLTGALPAPVAEPYVSPARALAAADFRGSGSRRALRPRPVRLKRAPRQSEPGISADPYFTAWDGDEPLGWTDLIGNVTQGVGIETPFAAVFDTDSALSTTAATLDAGTEVLGYVRAFCAPNGSPSGQARRVPLLARLRLASDGTIYGLQALYPPPAVPPGIIPNGAEWRPLADITDELRFWVAAPEEITDDGGECRTTGTTFGKRSGDRLAPPTPARGKLTLTIFANTVTGAKPLVDSAELVFTGDLSLTSPAGGGADGASPDEIETGLVDRGELEVEAFFVADGWRPAFTWVFGRTGSATRGLDEELVDALYDALASSAAAGPVLVGAIDGLLPPEAGALVDLDTFAGLGTGVVRYAVEGSARYDLIAETSEVQLIPAGDSIPGAVSSTVESVDAPTGLVVTGSGAEAGVGYVDLAWDAVADVDVDGYRVYRSEASGGPYTLVEDLTLAEIDAYGDSATPTYRAEALTLGTEYFFVVTAYQDVP